MRRIAGPRPIPYPRPDPRLPCLACGRPLESPLTATGSLRCLDCRDEKASLDPRRVRDWQEAGAHF
jgi:hypothetical protein